MMDSIYIKAGAGTYYQKAKDIAQKASKLQDLRVTLIFNGMEVVFESGVEIYNNFECIKTINDTPMELDKPPKYIDRRED